MANLALESGLEALAFARKTTLGLLDTIPEDKYLHQPMPGANHALWIAGHIAYADDYFLMSLGVRDKKLPESWHTACGYGSKLSTNAANFPTMGEIKDRLPTLREELCSLFKSKTAEQLLEPLPGDMNGFAPNYAAFIGAAACHESLHAGQLTVIRRSLKMAPVFG